MLLLFFKGLHIIGWVSWFAGFFYLGRMFVYHREAQDKPQLERDILLGQFNLMMERVYKIILNPAMMISWFGGLAVLYLYGMDWFKANGWMHIKLVFLFLLVGYHLWCKKMIKRLQSGEQPYNSFTFRLLNEMPTLFLVVIVMMAMYKNATNYFYLFGGLVVFMGLLFAGAKAYKRSRLAKG